MELALNNLNISDESSSQNDVNNKNDIEKEIEILKSIDWKVLESVYNTFGTSLNTNDMKNLKGKVYEIFVTHSHYNLRHVDQIGYDLITINGVKIEIKTLLNMFRDLGRKRPGIKKNISFRFKNSNGSGKIKIDQNNTADIYLLIQSAGNVGIGYVLGDVVKKYIPDKDGDIDVKIPNEYINMLYLSNKELAAPEEIKIDIPSIINRLLTTSIQSLWSGININKALSEELHRLGDELYNSN